MATETHLPFVDNGLFAECDFLAGMPCGVPGDLDLELQKLEDRG
jgi:hypothetical protein